MQALASTPKVKKNALVISRRVSPWECSLLKKSLDLQSPRRFTAMLEDIAD
jgi:hypothetical protein